MSITYKFVVKECYDFIERFSLKTIKPIYWDSNRIEIFAMDKFYAFLKSPTNQFLHLSVVGVTVCVCQVLEHSSEQMAIQSGRERVFCCQVQR